MVRAVVMALSVAAFCTQARAAELGVGQKQVLRVHVNKHVAYQSTCRTGWWGVYQDSRLNPRWGTRCYRALARR
jgi:hypothetical protein